MAAAPFDLIIRNGRVIDPANDLNEIADVGVKDRKIASVIPHIEERGQEEFDASGCIVTPGLIDGHVHIYQHVTPLGVNVDETRLARGVTTVVDAGSTGRNQTNTVMCCVEKALNDGESVIFYGVHYYGVLLLKTL